MSVLLQYKQPRPTKIEVQLPNPVCKQPQKYNLCHLCQSLSLINVYIYLRYARCCLGNKPLPLLSGMSFDVEIMKIDKMSAIM